MFLIRIEPVSGFIEDQHRRIVHDGLGESDATAKALGEGLDGLLQHRAKLQVLDDVCEACAPPFALQGSQIGDEFQEAPHRHLAIQRRPLGQVA